MTEVTRTANTVAFQPATKPRVLMVGTHLPAAAGNRSVGEGLAERLERSGFQITLTSRIRNRPMRVMDMLTKTWRSRGHYEVAQVDVYSGSAFRWAEWVASAIQAA